MSRSPTIEVKFTGDSRDLDSTTSRVEGNLTGLGGKVSGFAVGAGAALTTMGIQAIPALVNFGSELFNLGQASEIGLAKSRTVFGDSAASISTWADDVNESLGLSDEAVVGLAAGMGDLLVPLGFSRDAAAGMAMETTELAGALSAWSQGQYDASQVSEIMTKAMLGERDGLKALGISISQAEVDEKALAIARAAGRDAITAQDQALATQQLILEKSTDAQAAWADGTMDAVKNQNELSATIADAKEGLAKGLVPIVQTVVKWITDEMIPAVKNLVDSFREEWPRIKAAVEPVMLQIQEIVTSVLAVVTALWDTFGSTILRYVEIVWGYISNTIGNALQIIKGIIDVVLGVLTGDWSKAWEGIKAIVDGVWEQIKNLVGSALKVVGLLLDAAWEVIKGAASGAWDGIKGAISDALGGIIRFHQELPGRLLSALGDLAGLLWTKGSQLIDGLKSGASSAWTAVSSWVSGLPAAAVAAIGGLGFTLWTKGSELIDGLKSGASGAWTSVSSWVGGLPGKAKDAIGDLGRVLYNAGRDLLGGLLDGMKDAWDGMTGWIGGLGGKIKNLKGPPSYDKIVLESNGQLLIGGLLQGMKEAWPEVEAFAAGLAPQLSSSLALGSASGPRFSSPRPASTTTNIYNIPTGVTPTTVTEAGRQYVRTQGPI